MQALLLAVSDVAAESSCTGVQWYEQCSRVMLLVWDLVLSKIGPVSSLLQASARGVTGASLNMGVPHHV